MSTVTQTPRAARWPGARLGILVTALGTLVAIAVAVVLLALSGSSGKTTATPTVTLGPAVTYAPLIRYHGTGAAPVQIQHRTVTNAPTSAEIGAKLDHRGVNPTATQREDQLSRSYFYRGLHFYSGH
jgi:hypothetical protein